MAFKTLRPAIASSSSSLRTLIQSPSRPLFRTLPPRRAVHPSSVQTACSLSSTPDEKVSTPQWKAAIDFKWIRDNRDAVVANIKNRNSNVDLEMVLELYEEMLNLQKIFPRNDGWFDHHHAALLLLNLDATKGRLCL